MDYAAEVLELVVDGTCLHDYGLPQLSLIKEDRGPGSVEGGSWGTHDMTIFEARWPIRAQGALNQDEDD